jgi:hypothetical protein
VTSKNSGGSFAAILTLIFITLKLTSYITWSWWWVLGPLWIPITVVLVISLVIAIISGTAQHFGK